MTVYCHFMIMVVGNQLELACTDQTAQTHSGPGGSTCKHCHSSPLLVQSTHSWLVFKQQSMRCSMQADCWRTQQCSEVQGAWSSSRMMKLHLEVASVKMAAGFDMGGRDKKHKECLVFSGQLRRTRGVLSLESELNSTGLSRGDKKTAPIQLGSDG